MWHRLWPWPWPLPLATLREWPRYANGHATRMATLCERRCEVTQIKLMLTCFIPKLIRDTLIRDTLIRDTLIAECFPIPDSRFPIPDSLFPSS
ncbi:hypothetical protein [Moorena sp. SIOASIH]|uniref:hypothetical protein n=1 Tax=Moorena sp. SIOASIH TaxID=2607817 RepID=UPI0025D1592D|nr:hypothetical protein [Moorena sp. SIOASIH]